MSTEDKNLKPEQNQPHMHSHIDENGNVYTHCHDDNVLFSEHDHEHYHVDELGNLYSHVHDHGDDTQPHAHTHTKAVINRLSRAIGHLESVKRMVENGRDCTEVLIQLAAVRSALSSTAKVILKDHLEHCLTNMDPNDPEQFKALNDAIDRFM